MDAFVVDPNVLSKFEQKVDIGTIADHDYINYAIFYREYKLKLINRKLKVYTIVYSKFILKKLLIKHPHFVDFKSNNCNLINENFVNDNQNYTSSIYFVCNDYTIQISIFYRRGNFFWIASDNFNLKYKKWFNDIPRAINE